MKQKCYIVNADDCGLSTTVNEHIKKSIEAGRVTSTTVMANMHDLEGAVALYRQYGDSVSFGWHINLTEGRPILKSQVLLDAGYYVEKDGDVEFNGRAFWHKHISALMKSEIKKELIAQCSMIRDSGIVISHADGHHHIHTSPSMMLFFPSLLQQLGISRMRRLRNYVPNPLSYVARMAVGSFISVCYHEIRQVDTFCYFREYVNNPNLRQGSIVEMECHPGNPAYADEEKMLMDTDLTLIYGGKMITYTDF